jgi:uncharacterized membrane protein
VPEASPVPSAAEVGPVAATPPAAVDHGPVLPPSPRANALWAWLTGGNALTRIGVVIVFFGVAFLLKYFSEHFTVSIELRLAAVAAFGVALMLIGFASRAHVRATDCRCKAPARASCT